MIAAGNAEPFTRYAYAMELKSLGRLEESLAAFGQLRAAAPAYVAQYLMAGGVCESLTKNDDALAWYDGGIGAAKAAHDDHALSEIVAARNALATRIGA